MLVSPPYTMHRLPGTGGNGIRLTITASGRTIRQ